jgi:hypothetical protein
MLPDRFDRSVDLRPRKPQTLHDDFRHLGANSVVTVESDTPIFIHG